MGKNKSGRLKRTGCFLAGIILGLSLLLGVHWLAGRDELLKFAGQWLVGELLRQAMPLQWEKEAGEGYSRKAGEADPAYRKIQEDQSFYREHEYLAWYGDETTGQKEEGVRQEPETKASLEQEPGQEAVFETLSGSLKRPVTGKTYPLAQLADYDFLRKEFYSIHTSTTAGKELLDAKALLETDLSMKQGAEGPQILIYHTHGQEAYRDSKQGETVIGVGSYLTELLEAKGYQVYHDTTVYDLKNGVMDRSKAYNYALEGLEKILKENPSIEVVLDIHRDGVSEKLHLMQSIDGRDTAKIMFFNGLSRTPKGPISHLPNPYLKENLAFSLQLKLGAEAYFPGFSRNIYLKGLRYNEHLRPRSCLIEVGAQTNTYQEALNAMEPLAELLYMVLQGN